MSPAGRPDGDRQDIPLMRYSRIIGSASFYKGSKYLSLGSETDFVIVIVS